MASSRLIRLACSFKKCSTRKILPKQDAWKTTLSAVSTAPGHMPKIRRTQLPEAVLRHLLLRARERHISADQFMELASWLNSDPTVPPGRWFKRFPGFIICGEAE